MKKAPKRQRKVAFSQTNPDLLTNLAAGLFCILSLWKPVAPETLANSGRAPAFHRSHLNSHRLACGCDVGDSDNACILKSTGRIIRCRTGYQTWFSKSRRASQVLRTRFRDKCPLFQSIYYCFCLYRFFSLIEVKAVADISLNAYIRRGFRHHACRRSKRRERRENYYDH